MQYVSNFEKKLQGPYFTWLMNIFLAAIIYCNAEMDKLLGIKEFPLTFSKVWPPTGFSLAALLLLGSKMWPGILAGNFLYNITSFSQTSASLNTIVIVAVLVSVGSLLQALVGNSVIRRYSTSFYFYTVKDVFVFLLGGGLLTCLIASTIGILSIYSFGLFTYEDIPYDWFAFWLGDTLGIYLFTPLLVVWSLSRPQISIRKYGVELFCMLVIFLILTEITFIRNLSFGYLFIPFCIWVTYRFRMHGAVTAIFLIAVTSTTLTALRHNTFVESAQDPLSMLVIFLEVLVATCMIMAAVMNEKEAILQLITDRDLDLQKSLDLRSEELKGLEDEILVQKKISSHRMLTLNLAQWADVPHRKISQTIQMSKDCVQELQNILKGQKERLNSQVAISFDNNFKMLEIYLQSIDKLEHTVQIIAEAIKEQLQLTTYGKIQIQAVPLNSLINTCLNQIVTETAKSHPDFHFTLVKELDYAVGTYLCLPEDLSRAISLLLNNAMLSLVEKKDRLGTSFQPRLEVHTQETQDAIEIVIRDNGKGAGEHDLQNYFSSFVNRISKKETLALEEEIRDFDRGLAHDIIVYVHHGKIKVISKEGELLEVVIALPKR